jgi:glycosyltransferase involved in cell wall biosynthesis
MQTSKDLMLTLSPYRSRPFVTGGTKRIHFLNRGYYRHGWDVLQVSSASTRSGVRGLLRRADPDVAPGYREQIYFNPAILAGNWVMRKVDGPQIAAATLPRMLRAMPSVRRAMRERRVVMLEHPTLFDAVEPWLTDEHLLVLDAHNIEYRIFANALDDNDLVGRTARALRDLERRCFARADLAFMCSPTDRDIAVSEFGIDPARVHLAPNGVDIETTPVIDESERADARRRLGLAGPVAAFVGSRWGPNHEAVQQIVKLAAADPGVTWLVIGLAGEAAGKQPPANVRVTGEVADLRGHLAAADIAVNPAVSGSGSSIKMFEYLALGLPVVATPFGARGLDYDGGIAVTCAEIADMPDAVLRLAADPRLPERRAAARELAAANYDWTHIAGIISATIRARLGER